MKKFWPVQIVIFIIIIVIYWFSTTSYGMGVSPDSVCYLLTAESFSRYTSFFIDGHLQTHWPPGYPFVLGALCKSIQTDSLLICARILNLLLLLLIAFSFRHILIKLSFGPVESYIFSFAFVLSHAVIFSSLMVWSEILFLWLLLCSYFFWLKFRSTNRIFYIILLGFFLGLMFMVRYAALGIIGAYVILIILQQNNVKEKIRQLVIVLLPSSMIILSWIFFVLNYHINAVDRHLSWHPANIDQYIWGIKSILMWFLPFREKYVFIIILILAGFIFAWLFIRERKKIVPCHAHQFKQLREWIIISVVYFLFIWVTVHFFDPLTDFNGRILLPVFPFIYLTLLWFSIKCIRRPYLAYLLAGLMILSGLRSAVFHYQNGYAFSGKDFEKSVSALIPVIQNSHHKIISNAPEYLAFKFGYKPEYTDCTEMVITDRLIPAEQLLYQVKDSGAMIIYFDAIKRKRFISRDTLMQLFPSTYRHSFPGGMMIFNANPEM